MYNFYVVCGLSVLEAFGDFSRKVTLNYLAWLKSKLPFIRRSFAGKCYIMCTCVVEIDYVTVTLLKITRNKLTRSQINAIREVRFQNVWQLTRINKIQIFKW